MTERSQTGRLLHALKQNPDGIENWKFPQMRILRYSARIAELRAEGYPVIAERVYARGRWTGTFKYRLAGLESKKSRFQLFKRKERIAS